MLASCDTGQVRCRNFTSRISSRGGEKKMNGRANPRPTVLHYALGRFVYNIEGQTSQLLPVMRPILTAERGRRDRRGVLWLPRAPSSSYVDGCATPYAKVQWVRGAFFCSCSVHMAYRSAPCRAVSSCVHALVLQEVITARKRLAAFTYEGFLVRVERYHVPLEVLSAGEAFGATRNGTDVCALPCFVGFGHPSSAAFLDQVWDGRRRRDALAWCCTLGFPLRGGVAVDDGTSSGSRRW
jgi:hypothetical protein